MKLGCLCETIFSGGTPNTSNTDYWNGEFHWLSSGETRNTYIFNTEKTITQKGVDNSSTRLAKKNDVVIASAGQGKTRGQVSYCMIDTYINQSLISMRANPKLLDPKFLFYNLTSRYNELRTLSDSSSSRGSLTIPILENIDILLPPLKQQKTIATILSNYDDLIENNNKRIKILEEMAQKIYKEWFVDFNYPGHETVTFKDTELGKIPSDWEIKNLFDFVNVLYGYAFKSNLFTDKKDKIPVVRIRDIKNQKTDTYTSEVPDDKYYIKDKEILIGMDGEFHMCNWLGGRAYLNQRVAKLKPKDNQSYYYLFLLLQKPIKDLNIAIQGTTVAHLGDNHLRMLYFAIPNEQILEKFNFIVEKFLDEILNLTKKNKVLNEAKSLLLPRLMSGEIDVMDLEIN